MTKIASLQELMVESLKDLFSAETQLVEALPKMEKGATASGLKKAFATHLKQTEGHVQRLEQIFTSLGKSPRGKKCKAMEGLVEEGSEILKEEFAPEVRDAALIGAAQKVEHYEIAGYGTVRTFAQLLGDQKTLQLLDQTLNEEKATDKLLTTLAETQINVKAELGATNNR